MAARVLALLAAAAFVVAACGGAAAPTTTVTPSQALVATPAATVAATPAANPGGSEAAVAIVDFGFNSAALTIPVGTTVTWTNTGQKPHTVKSTDGGFASSGVLSNGGTYAQTFGTAGTFAYVCGIHAAMRATITVTP